MFGGNCQVSRFWYGEGRCRQDVNCYRDSLLEYVFEFSGLIYFLVAPEIIEVSGARLTSDIWSLGCTVIEMLTGHPPYYELTSMQALFSIVDDPHPPIPSSLPRELNHFLVSTIVYLHLMRLVGVLFC
jgi:hypothetical protein